MASHSLVLLLRINSKQYADAARQLRDGNQNASPLAVALTQQGDHILSGYTSRRITLEDISTHRPYSASVPALLAEYLAKFRRW